MAMTDKYVYKISSRYPQKMLSYGIKHVKNRHFHFISGFYRDFLILFLTDFETSKVL